MVLAGCLDLPVLHHTEILHITGSFVNLQSLTGEGQGSEGGRKLTTPSPHSFMPIIASRSLSVYSSTVQLDFATVSVSIETLQSKIIYKEKTMDAPS